MHVQKNLICKTVGLLVAVTLFGAGCAGGPLSTREKGAGIGALGGAAAGGLIEDQGIPVGPGSVLDALEAFQEEPSEFYPYSSKYDAWLAGTVRLTEPEERGRRLFIDPQKGDCARCHIAQRGAKGPAPSKADFIGRRGVISHSGFLRGQAQKAGFGECLRSIVSS